MSNQAHATFNESKTRMGPSASTSTSPMKLALTHYNCTQQGKRRIREAGSVWHRTQAESGRGHEVGSSPPGALFGEIDLMTVQTAVHSFSLSKPGLPYTLRPPLRTTPSISPSLTNTFHKHHYNPSHHNTPDPMHTTSHMSDTYGICILCF